MTDPMSMNDRRNRRDTLRDWNMTMLRVCPSFFAETAELST